MKKRITVVTQDEISANMATKAGVSVISSIENLESLPAESSGNFLGEEILFENDADNPLNISRTGKNLKGVGSNDFYEEAGQNEVKKIQINKTQKAASRENINLNKNVGIKSMRGDIITPGAVGFLANGRKNGIDEKKGKMLENLFAPKKEQKQQKQQNELREISVKGRTKKIAFIFILLCVLVFFGIGAYLFIPKASIVVTLFSHEKKIDMDISGSIDQGEVNFDSRKIPIRILQEKQELSLTYDATGENDASGTKARGNVVLYNNFSSQSQTLIATTRLESADGKIFRLTKDHVIPGTTQVGSEMQPGAIEVEVIADKTGSEYNIDASDFSIPGFKGGPKFEKFSAKSTKSMTGGGSSGEQVKAISQQDIDNAKKDIEAKLKTKVQEILKSKLGSDDVLLDGALQYGGVEFYSAAKAGTVQDTFEYKISLEFSALVFSQKDVEKILVNEYEKENKAKDEVESVKVDYAGFMPDFENKTMSVKLHGEVFLKADLNEEKLKNELLGKNEEEVKQLMAKYPQIKNISFEFEPKIISRVPKYSSRVSVEIKSEN